MIKKTIFILVLLLNFDFATKSAFANIAADHTVISQFSSLSQAAVNTAAAKKVLFYHQSTGGYIDDGGLNCLAGLRGWEGYPQECFTYAANYPNGWPLYPRSNWNWPMWPEPQADAIAKIDQFYSLRSTFANYDVVGMKYCYVDGWNQGDNVDQQYYINKMLQLEALYPNKTFIWATSVLWADPGTACSGSFNSCENIAAFNQQVRAYAKAHNKPLYDLADIESHDQNGNPCTVAGYEGLCSQWYDSGGGHPNIAGAIRLAKGFWWLMANLGTSPTASPTQTPILGDLNGDGRVDILDLRQFIANFTNIFDYNLVVANFGK